MNKIIAALLQAKFPTLNVEDLLEVINATANPTTATEVLCGLYELPKINSFSPDTDSEINKVFLSYDKYNDKVFYSYNKREYKQIIVRKDRTELPSFDDKTAIQCSYVSYMPDKLKLPKEECELNYEIVIIYDTPSKDSKTSETSLSNWNK